MVVARGVCTPGPPFTSYASADTPRGLLHVDDDRGCGDAVSATRDVILTRGSAAGGRAGSASDGTIRSCTDFDSVQFAVSSAIIFTARVYYAKQGL